MFKKQTINGLFLVLVLFLLIGITGRESWAQKSTTGETSKPMVLKIAQPGKSGIHLDIVLKKFGELVEHKTGGKVKVEVYAQTLGGGKDLVEQTALGTIQMYADGYTGEQLYNLLFLPYLFRDWNHMKTVLLGPVGQKWSDKWVANKGIRAVGYFQRLPRQLTTKKRPVVKPDDLKGLKIRIPDWKVAIRTWEILGAKPTPMAWPEVFSALQSGVIEAQDNPVDLVYDERLYEVQKYMIIIDYMQNVYYVGANNKWYTGLPADIRKAIDEALRESEIFNDKLLAQNRAGYLKKLQEKGMTVINADEKAFRSKLKDLYKEFIPDMDKMWGPGVYEQIKKS